MKRQAEGGWSSAGRNAKFLREDAWGDASWQAEAWDWTAAKNGYGGSSPSSCSSWISEQDKADIIQWQECSKVGSPLPGTSIVPVKTPFEGSLQEKAVEAGLISEEDAFTKADLLEICEANGHPIGAVIDLVNTQKYYKGFTFEEDGIEYHKVPIPGRTVPAITDVKKIFGIIDEFAKRCPGYYVAIHCTHGVNRTGFFCAAYLLTRTAEGRKMSSVQAIQAFQEARGTPMDKVYLMDALRDIVASRPKGAGK
mmetsp:Transcript_48490/g.75535  ORF Transcript_48490/g.75535 Transcript_48490/m.75535 type:complete len:253 (-) Transcript_48490:4-762(-)